MPKISVNEHDLSWYYRQRTSGAITVYMPGVATFGPEEPTLVNKDDFTRIYGTSPVADTKDRSYNTAASFVNSGFDVLFHRIVPETAKASTVEILKLGDDSSGLSFKAKYPGSYGNNLKIKIQKQVISDQNGTITDIILYVVVYDKSMNLLERATFSLFNINDANYYEIANINTKFVEVVVSKDMTMSDAGNMELSSDLYELTEGTDGTVNKIVDDAIAAVKEGIGDQTFTEKLLDPYQYWFDVIVDGGINDVLATGGTVKDGKVINTNDLAQLSVVDNAFMELAKKRGNAIYFVDGHPDMAEDAYYNYCNNFNTSYCAAFGPWGYAQFISNGVTTLLPGSYAAIVSWAQSAAAGNPVWLAPAGVKRSQLGSFYKSSKYVVDHTILDSWQNHEYVEEAKYKINPIMKLKQYGYCIYGNSTLLHNQPDGSTSMLQSFSVRVLSNLIKSHAFDVSLNLQFDQITDDLFAQFKTLMGVFMDQLKYSGALYDYKLVVDRSSMTNADLNTKTVPVRIMISPNPAVENFVINLEISQAGVSFNDDTDETEVA